MAHDVFVSYSSSDKPIADAVVATLERAGIRCWVAPRDVMPGDKWADAIVRAIGAGRLMVLVFTSDANDSQHIIREVGLAAQHGMPLIPLRVEDVKPSPTLDYYIAGTHWLDAIDPPLEAHLERLALVVGRLLESPPAEMAAGPDAAAKDVLSPLAPQVPVPIPEMPGPARGRRWLLAGAIALAVIAAGVVLLWPRGSAAPGGVQSDDASVPPSSPTEPEVVPSPTEPQMVFVPDGLATADCMQTPESYAESQSSQAHFWRDAPWPSEMGVVPCEEPHGAEVLFAGNAWPAGAVLPDDRIWKQWITNQWRKRCSRQFAAYVDPRIVTPLALTGSYPAATEWADGDRRMECIVYDKTGADLVGSVTRRNP